MCLEYLEHSSVRVMLCFQQQLLCGSWLADGSRCDGAPRQRAGNQWHHEIQHCHLIAAGARVLTAARVPTIVETTSYGVGVNSDPLGSGTPLPH